MSLPELSAAAWTAKLMDLPRPGTENVLAFYEHRMGAFCRDPRLLLVPLDDHLVHRGDGIFESLRACEGKVLQLDAHIRRMRDSAAAIGLKAPCPWEQVRKLVLELAAASFASLTSSSGSPEDQTQKPREGALKLLMGRGPGGLGVDPKECPQSSLYMVATQSRPLPESYWENGLRACRSAIPAKQPYLAQIKSTNYLPNALMTQEAAKRGVNISFSFDENGFLAEAAIANVGVVDAKGRLLLPHFHHALPGTTALLAKDLAEGMMPVILTDITEEILYAASEILVFGTTPACVAVTHYEGQTVGNGKPGPMARKLRQVLQAALLAGGTPFP